MTENALKPYVIGLDLGGTNSVFGIVDARGEIKATTAIKTGGYDDVNDYVKAAVEALQPIIDTVVVSTRSRRWVSVLLTAITIAELSSSLLTWLGLTMV